MKHREGSSPENSSTIDAARHKGTSGKKKEEFIPSKKCNTCSETLEPDK